MGSFRCILTTRRTEKAYLIRVAGGKKSREIWLPRSVLTKGMLKFAPDAKGERECVVEAEDWWCEKNGL